MSNSSRRRSSARISKDHVRESKECKSEKVESGDKIRKKNIEQKVLKKNVKGVKDLDPNTSVCSSKDPVQRSINCKSESSRAGKSQEKRFGNKVLSDIKSIKDASSDTRIKMHKKENERKGRQNSDTVSSQNKSNQKTKKQSQKLVVDSKETHKLKNKKESGDNECDFSKIENMIFEDHLDKGIPVKKRISSQGEKGKISKHSAQVTKKVCRPREISKSDRKSKTSLQVTGKSKVKTTDMARKHKKAIYREKNIEKQNASDSDSSDWEEVDESCGKINEMEALLDESQDNELLKKTSVKIELDAPDVLLWGMKKRKKRRTEDEMIEEYLRKHLNRSIKEVHENMHKTHVLCLFAHGRNINRILNSEVLLGAALSLITDKNAYPPKRLDMSYLEKFVNWFSRKITLKIQDLESNYWSLPLESLMVKRFENKNALSNRELVYMFVIMTRALGMNVRLVLSLQPMPWKPSTAVLLKRIKKEEEESKSSLNEPSCSKATKSYETETQIRIKVKDKNSKKMLSSDSDVEIQSKKKNVMKNISKDICSGSKPSKVRKKRSSSLSDGSDSDFDPGIVVKKSPKLSVISKKRKSIEGSNDEDKKRKLNGKKDVESKKRKSEPLLEWAEVYVEEEEKWICIDITKAKIHCIAEIENRTPSSSVYITAYSANLTVKDVTRRYIASWLSKENKMRCCTKWWEKTLQPFRGKRTRLDKEEENEMDQNLRQQPLPKVIGEYKNHPLYALQRHLLKFEAIYPPDEYPVGYIKGEPVYPRSSVYTLCSRDTWVKEAKTVRVGEEPYKIVKARPKWDRNTCQVIKDRPLEVFGEWQVEDYEPPVASGGKVPRNEYGNVELFKPTMLPRGCVHLTLPGLNRVARKLNIDCAAAMVGFDFHSGWTHPVYDGFVVCEEFKDTLLDAWNQEQDEMAKRAEEKRQKRVYDNWKRLIRGMMVKERVKQTYGNVTPLEDDEDDQAKVKTPDECKDKTKEKSRIKGEKKNEPKKTKVTQEDIDAARPPLITHTVQNLKIDLTSCVIDMAKESRRKTMKTSNSVKVKVKQDKKKSSQPLPDKESNLDNSSDETDEEEKKEKIRAILNWGARTVTTNPDLSDDSDIEGDLRPSCSKSSTLNKLHANTTSHIPTYKKPKTRESKHVLLENCTESHSSATSCSTTPEPCAEELTDLVPRRVSRRSRNANTGIYAESDGDNEGDISLDESDVEDKTYNPLKEKKKTLNLSESD